MYHLRGQAAQEGGHRSGEEERAEGGIHGEIHRDMEARHSPGS